MAHTKLAYINDLDVWEYLEGLKNFSAWVRDQARKELKKQAGIDPELAQYIEELLSQRLSGRQAEPVIVMADAGRVDPEECGFL